VAEYGRSFGRARLLADDRNKIRTKPQYEGLRIRQGRTHGVRRFPAGGTTDDNVTDGACEVFNDTRQDSNKFLLLQLLMLP
jgi:hypothetical protein